MRIRGVRRWRTDQGNVLVEFTFIVIMLVMVMLGIVEMGRMMLVYTTVANSARAGARYAIVHGAERTGSGVNGPSGPGNTTQVKTVVRNFAGAGLVDISKLNINVAYPNGTSTADSPVTVTVTYPYDPWVPYFRSLLNVTLGSTSEGVITF
jgi:Flp pilus assembly protein TadG